MITESELRDTLVRQAESYEVPPLDLMSLRAAAERRRSGTSLRYGAMAAAALLAVGVALGLLRWGQGDVQPADSPSDVTVSPSCVPPGQAPPVPDSQYAGDGFLSDEPASATTPGDRSCTLVLRYWFHRLGAGSGLGKLVGTSSEPGFSGMVWLYSDGRLIVDTDEDWFVQWERQLTPAGVERVRTAVVAMLGERVGRHIDLLAEIHYGDGAFYPDDPQALVRMLIDRSWLPDKYWVRQSGSVYHPAWYQACYTPKPSALRQYDDVQAAVRELPAGARDVLESREWTAVPPDPDAFPYRAECLVMDRADATVLIEALGGDPAAGKAFVDLTEDLAGLFGVVALMPDGESGGHGD